MIMQQLEELVITLTQLNVEEITTENIKKYKREFAKTSGHKDLPTNMQLLKIYQQMVKDGAVEVNPAFQNSLKKRAVRSMSWIVPIQVLTKPFRCPGKCIFCPNDATMPKSYINTEPGAMRALLNNFDPLKQVYNRLLSLKITWHATDKIEMIVLGGTWDVYPQSYKTAFVKWLYDACNTFDQFLSQIDIDIYNPKAAKFTITDKLNIEYPQSIEESIKINETTEHRIIWLTVETRPEYVTDENCQYWRSLGVTRIEMWIQSMFDDVLDANERGHSVDQVRAAMHKLRQYAFKISTHFMPGLYGSDLQKDIQTFEMAYNDPYIKSDEIKFYPTSVIANTKLYDLFLSWEYKPMADEDLISVIKTVLTEIIPPYTRIKRLIRDIPSTEIIAGSNITNLRQLTEDNLLKEFSQDEKRRLTLYGKLYWNSSNNFERVEEFYAAIKNATPTDSEIITFTLNGKFDVSRVRNFISLCTRSREIRHDQNRWNDAFLVARVYKTSNGKEIFLSFENQLGYLYWFARLLLPSTWTTIDIEWLWHSTALIRELHVYWQLAKIWQDSSWKTQHQWFWSSLMEASEVLSKISWYDKISVISGVGVRKYYEKLWYVLNWTYMIKDL